MDLSIATSNKTVEKMTVHFTCTAAVRIVMAPGLLPTPGHHCCASRASGPYLLVAERPVLGGSLGDEWR